MSILLRNARLATLAPGLPGLGIVENGAVLIEDGHIAFAGEERDAAVPANARVVDCEGRWITPGLIDCHTHLVFAGDRADEFEKRLGGATYEEIARAGGGIRSTVTATRAASEDDLVAAALPRLDRLLAEGVTTIEVKSGYGLSVADELKQLAAARRLATQRAVDVRTTLLGAHALPPEYEARRADYLALVRDEMIPRAAAQGLADAVDAFCEIIAFTPDETATVFDAAARHGLPVKLHADQLSDLGGAALAARYKALSADHLECTGEAGVAAMAAAGTVAVLLPGAFYFLRETRLPPVEALRRHKVPMALASDINPGSSPALSLLLMLNMACTLFRLTPEEALTGVTRAGAAALGLGADRGVLAPGYRADFVLWDIARPADLAYWIGGNPQHRTVKDGRIRT
ncbi:MAG: imidazolonepropionase [Rhodospirillaceae bacterium]|nr:imidazolonepropionase [Rhodospirillaceae bacterium]